MASSGGSVFQILVCHNTLWVRALRGPENVGVGGRERQPHIRLTLPVQTCKPACPCKRGCSQPPGRTHKRLYWKGPFRGGHRYLSANNYTYIQDRQPPCHRHHTLVYVVGLHWYLYSTRYMCIYTYQDMCCSSPRHKALRQATVELTKMFQHHPTTRLPSCFYCLCVSDTSPPEPLEELQDHRNTCLPSCVSCLCFPDTSPPETLFQHDDLFNLINNLPPPMHESALGSQSEQELLTAMAKASAAAAAAATGSELASRQSGLENASMVCLQTEGGGQGSTNLYENEHSWISLWSGLVDGCRGAQKWLPTSQVIARSF